jgi:hypothetical protein
VTPALPANTSVTSVVPGTGTSQATASTVVTGTTESFGSTLTLGTLPVLDRSGGDKAKTRAADLTDDAVAALLKTVETLLAAVTSGDVGQVASAVTDVITGLVDLVVATLAGSDLPAPTMAGLPQLPTAPQVPAGTPAQATDGLLPAT